MRTPGLILATTLLIAFGCGSDDETRDANRSTGSGGAPGPNTNIALLGNGSHDVTQVKLVEVSRQTDGLNMPRDLAFNPSSTNELWVVNEPDDSMVVYSNVGLPNQTSRKYIGATGGDHFLAKPVGIAFGKPGEFATIHDEDQPTQGEQTPADFMGPVLWTSDLAIFDGGMSSHYDMLHNSPLGMGIAWERDNVYWVFDGYHGSITRYDFRQEHQLGGTDHTDGIITRYVEGQVKRLGAAAGESTPSHLELLPGTSRLYIADSGNGRIGLLDLASGIPGGAIGPNYDECTMNRVDGDSVQTIVQDMRMPYPSGIAIRNVLVGGEPRDVIFVTDISTSTVYAWSLDGELLDWVPLKLPGGSLSGITFDTVGNLWLVDGFANRVLRLEPGSKS